MRRLNDLLFGNSLVLSNPEPGQDLVLASRDSNNALVLHQEPIPSSMESNLEKACKDVNNTTSSFNEDFPNYDQNDDLFPFKMVKYAFKYFQQLSSDKTDSISQTILNPEITNNLKTKDTIIDKIPNNLSTEILNNYQNIGDYKPFGFLAKYSINDIVSAIKGINSEALIDLYNMNLEIQPLKLISAGILYKTVVNCYTKSVYPMSTLDTIEGELKKKEWLKIRQKNITLFMIGYVPFITYGLFTTCNSNLLNSIKIDFTKQSKSVESLCPLLFISKLNKTININSYVKTRNINSFNNQNKKNISNKPNSFKNIIILVICLFLIISIINFNYLLDIILNLSLIKVLKFNIMISVLLIIYKIIDIFIFILFIKRKIKIPYYLPLFLFEWLNQKQKISYYAPKEIRAFMDLFIRDLFSHIFALLIMIIIYFYLS